MANRSVTARANKNEVSIQHNETDSPIIPVASLERLHAFRPDLIDWCINQTEAEAVHRRNQEQRIVTYTFIERMAGQVCAILIGLGGIFGGGYVAIHGSEIAGGTIATAAIATLAVAFITRKKSTQKPE